MPRPVIAYCDGSAHVGFGGVGVVWLWGAKRDEYSVGFRSEEQPLGEATHKEGITNQTMELFAAVTSLMMLAHRWQGKPVIIRSDSAYLCNCFNNGWLARWRADDWHTSGGKPVANRALWETLECWVELFHVTFQHVKGHAGDEHNERAHALASAARKEIHERFARLSPPTAAR